MKPKKQIKPAKLKLPKGFSNGGDICFFEKKIGISWDMNHGGSLFIL